MILKYTFADYDKIEQEGLSVEGQLIASTSEQVQGGSQINKFLTCLGVLKWGGPHVGGGGGSGLRGSGTHGDPHGQTDRHIRLKNVTFPQLLC